MGLVGQSFCAALQQELTEYYRLLAVLEGQQQLGDAGFVGEGASGSLTLRRLMVWTFDPLTRLQTLAALVDACKGEATVLYKAFKVSRPCKFKYHGIMEVHFLIELIFSMFLK